MNLKKGSKAARDFMARLRAMKGGGKKAMRKNPTKRGAPKGKQKPARYWRDVGDGMVEISDARETFSSVVSRADLPYYRSNFRLLKREEMDDNSDLYEANPKKRKARAGYTLKIGNREMGVTGVSQDEAAALAKKIAKMEGKKVEVFEGKF